ncbi:YicC/YloC family endoribonuclease [Selenomonas flueggei]|uniref:Putative TIGR00255 family protein n=1 Tax=Selenomonas flueggei ATCC 43531 TaxID=638302 RepID=C4V4G2_9FIRM|nr:YicC/YloC family endoribonuclease [Selenomonas flueggei]EEQ48426.1 putative TIGR00255 family protein [Selenomonas flueggei ATCC 43531]
MSTQRRSMTGYGAGTAETADYRVVVEMKAVNQRFLEIAPHMPRAFGAWEGDLRDLIRTRVARGKLDVYVSFEDRSEKRYAVHVNEGLARAYYAALGRVAHAVDAPLSDGVRMTAAYEGVITISEDADLSGARSVFLDAAAQALDALDVMRLAEGAHIVRDFEKRLARLEEQREEVKQHAPQIAADYRAHLTAVLAEFRAVMPDETRIMQEAALYADRVNVTEELVRLASHFAQFRTILAEEEPVGRRLDFLLQEINRETNTIGSKVNSAAIQQVVVAMKNEVEKLREQVQNLE